MSVPDTSAGQAEDDLTTRQALAISLAVLVASTILFVAVSWLIEPAGVW